MVFKKMRMANLKLKASKCNFANVFGTCCQKKRGKTKSRKP